MTHTDFLVYAAIALQLARLLDDKGCPLGARLFCLCFGAMMGVAVILVGLGR